MPGRDETYAELVARYRTTPEFRRQVDAVAAGQGLEVLDCSPLTGFVLAATGPESSYYLRLSEYAVMTAETRQLHAFAYLAIAATCFPNADLLENEDAALPQITAADVVRYMKAMAKRVAEQRQDADQPADPPTDHPELEPLYRLVGRWREGDTTSDERSNPNVLTGIVKKALKWMERNGFADEVGTAKGVYRIRNRFRVHVKDAGFELGTMLAALRQAAPAEGEA